MEAAAEHRGIPPVLLLAMLKAESGLDPSAERWGQWPDISFGLSQVTVATAAGYGLGDGSDRPENVALVRQALFDPVKAVDLGAWLLSDCLAAASVSDLSAAAGDILLGALVVYNAGHLPGAESPYWQDYAGNVQRYREALLWAKGVWT